MRNRIFLLLFILLAAVQLHAQDTLYVVQGGQVTGSYVVGKDIDRISLKSPSQPQTDNSVVVDGNVINLHSALVYQNGGNTYVFVSPDSKVADFQSATKGTGVMLAMPDSLFGRQIDFSKVDAEQVMVYAYYLESGEPVVGATCSPDDWKSQYQKAVISADTIGGELHMAVDFSGGTSADFTAHYNGTFTMQALSQYYFVVDDFKSDVRTAFVDHQDDMTTIYLSPAEVETADELQNVYYYAAVMLPDSLLDGRQIDITGNDTYALALMDNLNGGQQTLVSTGDYGSTTGTISVVKEGDGYKLNITANDLGGHQFSTFYEGTPKDVNTEKPNAVTVGESTVALRSALVSEEGSYYHVYLSHREQMTSLADAADADVELVYLKEYATGDVMPFGIEDGQEVITVKYDGETYNRKSTNSTQPNANGGNARLVVEGNSIGLDATVYGAVSQGKRDIKVHFTGDVTKI